MMTSSTAAGRESVTSFLQDVIGREQTLEPKCGRLREIHARIGKEVQDAKKELHATVQGEWPTLQKQYTTTVDLSKRLKTIQGNVGELETTLDGSDSALRPRLQASLKAHAELASRHQASETLVELLASLHAIQQAIASIQSLLDQGRLDAAVPAIQTAERLLDDESTTWKRHSRPYQAMREQCRHLRILAQERLQAAFERCVVIRSAPQPALTVSISTLSEPQSANYDISLQAILTALAALEPLDQHFTRISKVILKNLVEPIVVTKLGTLANLANEDGTRTIQLDSRSNTDLSHILESLRLLLKTIRTELLPSTSAAAHRALFFANFIPPLQQLLITHVLQTSIPDSANASVLSEFQKVCEAVSKFEQQDLLSETEGSLEPILQEWAANAGKHWSRSILERCFAQLRSEIASPQYWDKTETVDWVDDARDVIEPPQASSASNGAPKLPMTGIAAMSGHNIALPTSTPDASVKEDQDMEPEEDAWGLDITPDQSPAVPSTSRLAPLQSNTVEASPDPNADDAWGLVEDEDEEEEAAQGGSNGKVFTTAVGVGHNEEEEEEAGWSFDDDDGDTEMPDAPAQTRSGRPTHSRNVSLEDWDAWSKPEQEQLARPIGKPTKVISGKIGGRKSLQQQEESNTPLVSEVSQSVTQVAPVPVPTLQEPFVPVQPVKPVPVKKVVEKMLVSTRSRRVVDIATDLLQASLAVSESSNQPSSFASSSSTLSQAFDDTFDLYRAIMPVAHKELLSSVPSIGMQFANDCIWISREAGKIVGKGKGRQQESTGDSQRTLERMRRFGEAVMEDQLELQRTPLIECLDEADGLRNTDDPQAFQRCQRSIRQIVSTLDRLSHAWKPVMRKRTYYESLGILVNAALLRVLVDIENQEDISEEASLRLNDLCKMLHELEGLFMDGEESTVALHVPVWFKFKFLSELLEASMADIMFLYNEGHLVDFSSTELTKLIYALFAESQLRQRNLDTIARGR